MSKSLKAAIGAVAGVAALALGAASAQASVGISDSTPTDGQSLTVSGMAPTFSPNPATHYAVAECNVEGLADPEDWAGRCNATGGGSPPRFRNVSALGSFGIFMTSITVDDAFTDVNFAGGPPPGTSTTCKGASGDQCAVVVSYYRATGGTPAYAFLGAEKVNVTFP